MLCWDYYDCCQPVSEMADAMKNGTVQYMGGVIFRDPTNERLSRRWGLIHSSALGTKVREYCIGNASNLQITNPSAYL
jgi:hypothetical protein